MVKSNFYFATIIILMMLFGSCQKKTSEDKHPYHSVSTEALYLYRLGWQQIMDEGFYAKAETSYQKALIHDPDFLVAKSVYARLVLDNALREKLYSEVEAKKKLLPPDERLLIDVYQALVNYTNLRESKHPQAKDSLQKALKLGEHNFGLLIKKYPDEVHIKAEYVEIIHSLYGDKAALDTLQHIAHGHQRLNPFLQGYTAGLLANLGYFEKAHHKADSLLTFFEGLKVPKPHVVKAEVLFKQKKWEQAEHFIETAYQLDHRNLDASRLRSRIQDSLRVWKKQNGVRVQF